MAEHPASRALFERVPRLHTLSALLAVAQAEAASAPQGGCRAFDGQHSMPLQWCCNTLSYRRFMPVPYRKAVSISLPPPLLKEVAQRAKQQHQTTSELVREALRRYLEDRNAADALWKDLRAYGAKRAKTLRIKTEADIQRVVDEYRRGGHSLYAPASRR